MIKQEFAPFYVGQEVEAVETGYLITKGSRYTVTKIRKGACCGWDVFVDDKRMPKGYNEVVCISCKRGNRVKPGSPFPFTHTAFRAITPAMEAVTFEKITEQHPVSVN